MTKTKWYVVWEGKSPGVYTTWEETKLQVHGIKGAKYQSFKTKWAAEEALKHGPNSFQDLRSTVLPDIIENSLSVDAACSGNPGVVEYQGVYTGSKTPVFHKKIDGLGTNNIGEFLAIVHGLAWQASQGVAIPIYSDSDVAIGWVKRKKCKTTLEKNKQTAPIFDLIDRAEAWLTSNEFSIVINKWLTSDWGEIPADFGRKG
ncbi:MAG: ribonuclease H family protein [Candidatus Margulisiibacteriota bacterium]